MTALPPSSPWDPAWRATSSWAARVKCAYPSYGRASSIRPAGLRPGLVHEFREISCSTKYLSVISARSSKARAYISPGTSAPVRHVVGVGVGVGGTSADLGRRLHGIATSPP